MSLLEFEREMLLSVANEDSLTITSKGMGADRLLMHLVKAYCDETSLVFVIGSSVEEEEFVIEQLRQEDAVSKPPTRVTSESVSSSQRKQLYMSGGVFFVTSRILVVDMLCDRVPFPLITGFVICKAHRIIEDCQQSFILRLFRMNNKTGFITAISQSPGSFVGGFGKLDKTMRLLFTNKLFLWPRFHATINTSLSERTAPEVIEVRLSMTKLMLELQFTIMDLISMCLKELSGTSSSFLYDSSEVTAENVVSGNFAKIIRTQFDPVWHQLNAKAKRLINDLRLLKSLLFNLINYDSVTFYGEVKAIRSSVVLNSDTSEWLFWEPAEKLFVASKQRLFNEKGEIEFEEHPKWSAFSEIIAEIVEKTKDNEDTTHVIVIVENERTIIQLKDLQEHGADFILSNIYDKCQLLLEPSKTIKEDKKKEGASKSKKSAENLVTLTQMLKKLDDSFSKEKSKCKLCLHYFQWQDKSVRLETLLIRHRPKHIILYEPEMQCIRMLELHQALRCSPDTIKIYFFMFDGSAEEQRYLKSLHKEKEAFEILIKSKASLIIPSERDGRCEAHPDLTRDEQEPSTSTRQAASQAMQRNNVIKQKIIVDMREFRSDLPSLIHKRGIEIEPVTLEVGDYLLTNDTCVERKSVSDLIGSLNNGRLYHQAQMMTRFYPRSLLLIEFDGQKTFNFKGRYWGVTSAGRSNDVLSKLVMLTIQFPQLRLIWSPAPHFSAEVFEYLKENKEQPDVNNVPTSSGKQLPSEYTSDKYDIGAKEFLLCLPGVTVQNVYSIMNQVENIAALVALSVEELTEIIGNSQQASLLYKALHVDISSLAKSSGDEKGKKIFKKLKSS